MLLRCKKVEREIDAFLIIGKRVGPAPVAQKRGHKFNIALLNWWLPAGKVERHGWIECKRQADKSRIVLGLPGREFKPETSAP
jgi:hypothetical protein